MHEPGRPLPWWYVVALAAHSSWGLYPVLGRYLQTVSGLPSMSVLVLGGLPLFCWLLVGILPRHGWRLYTARVLWLFGGVTVLRSITNLLAQRYTLALYVQMIGLLTPFWVVLIHALLFRERLPRSTLPAMLLSTAGALLMFSGSSAPAPGLDDWLGIGLALASSFFLAGYMLLLRRTAQVQISGLSLLAFQTVLVQACALGLSLLWQEPWERWLQLEWQGWTAFAAYSGVVVLGANSLQIAAVRRLGAPLVSSLMGWRLVATLVAGWWLLGEQLTTVWQVVGMLLVLAAVSGYLSRQRS